MSVEIVTAEEFGALVARVAELEARLAATTQTGSTWRTIPAAADYLGLTEPAVRHLVDRGLIPKYQPSGKRGRILLRIDDLDAYLDDNRDGRSRP